MPRGPDEAAENASALWRLSGLGIEFVATVGGMILVGWLLDRWLKTAPWLLIAGAGLGLLGGTIKFVREALAASRRAQEAYRREHPHGSPRAHPREDDNPSDFDE